MRENLINGTIDFQEVPIVDMNPEDIRVFFKLFFGDFGGLSGFLLVLSKKLILEIRSFFSKI